MEIELRQALKEQYHAGLAMLAQCVEICPEELWIKGEHPRTFWRIAWHAAFYAQFYLVENEAAFNISAPDWPLAVRAALGVSASQNINVEPYGLPQEAMPLTQQDLGEYIKYVRGLVDAAVDSLALDCPETGFAWYPHMTKLSHELMNLRHLQGHVGQLSERLLANGIEIDWVGKAGGPGQR